MRAPDTGGSFRGSPGDLAGWLKQREIVRYLPSAPKRSKHRQVATHNWLVD